MFTTLKDPAAAVLTVADVGVGLPEVRGCSLGCEGREQKVTFFFVFGVCLSD